MGRLFLLTMRNDAMNKTDKSVEQQQQHDDEDAMEAPYDPELDDTIEQEGNWR